MTPHGAGDRGAVHIDLPDGLTAASVARARTLSVLTGWRMFDIIEPMTLAVSELVANAVRHGRPPVDMLLRQVGRGVRVEVHDNEPRGPHDPSVTGQFPDLDTESGRGRFIVAALSTSNGTEDVPGDGKVVWATVEPDLDVNPLCAAITPPAG